MTATGWRERVAAGGAPLVAGLALVAALPLILPPVQALIDLPAHLGQYHVANHIARSEALRHFYAFTWRLIPNLGVDVLVAGLGPLLGDERATRLVVAAIPALTVAGLLLTARVAHRGRIPATALPALALAYNYPLTFGFVNSTLSMALAFLLFAPWLALTLDGRSRARLLLSLAAAPLLFFTHIIGYGLFGIMAGGAALARAWRPARPVASLREAVLACLPLAWPLAFTLLGHRDPSGTTGGWINLGAKAKWTIGLLRDGWAPFDVAGAAVLLAVASLPLWWRWRFGVVPVLGVPALLLWLAAYGLPTRIMGSEFASVRLIPAACALGLLAVAPRRPLPGWARPAALAFVGARWIGNAAALLLAGQTAADRLGALERVAPGSRVIAFAVVPCTIGWAPPRLEHLASYATVRRDAFVNDDFGNEAGQLLRRRDPALLDLPPAHVMPDARCARTWPPFVLPQELGALPWGRFDYLWLLDAPVGLEPHDGRLVEAWRRPGSVLYAVRRRPADAPRPPSSRP